MPFVLSILRISKLLLNVHAQQCIRRLFQSCTRRVHAADRGQSHLIERRVRWDNILLVMLLLFIIMVIVMYSEIVFHFNNEYLL